MYEAHFGLRQRPFRPTPDSEGYYPATTHEQALGRLLRGIADDEGMLLLTGAPGTGKTLLCHRLLERLDPGTAGALITNGRVGNRAGLLQAILYEFSLPYEGRGQQEMRLALTEFFLQNYQKGQRVVLSIDEAHHLSADLLEELRLLGNLEAGTGKAVQVVLIAQPAIADTLQGPELAAVRQRLAIRVHLEPLDLQEAVDFLVHHLRVAGGRVESIVADEALEILARGTQGIPRLLNQTRPPGVAPGLPGRSRAGGCRGGSGSSQSVRFWKPKRLATRPCPLASPAFSPKKPLCRPRKLMLRRDDCSRRIVARPDGLEGPLIWARRWKP